MSSIDIGTITTMSVHLDAGKMYTIKIVFKDNKISYAEVTEEKGGRTIKLCTPESILDALKSQAFTPILRNIEDNFNES